MRRLAALAGAGAAAPRIDLPRAVSGDVPEYKEAPRSLRPFDDSDPEMQALMGRSL
jgi:hypothetical protein